MATRWVSAKEFLEGMSLVIPGPSRKHQGRSVPVGHRDVEPPGDQGPGESASVMFNPCEKTPDHALKAHRKK